MTSQHVSVAVLPIVRNDRGGAVGGEHDETGSAVDPDSGAYEEPWLDQQRDHAGEGADDTALVELNIGWLTACAMIARSIVGKNRPPKGVLGDDFPVLAVVRPECPLVVHDLAQLPGEVLCDAPRNLGIRPNGQRTAAGCAGLVRVIGICNRQEGRIGEIGDLEPTLFQHLMQKDQPVDAIAMRVPAVVHKTAAGAVAGVDDERRGVGARWV